LTQSYVILFKSLTFFNTFFKKFLKRGAAGGFSSPYAHPYPPFDFWFFPLPPMGDNYSTKISRKIFLYLETHSALDNPK
jgi:hypothetical protein